MAHHIEEPAEGGQSVLPDTTQHAFLHNKSTLPSTGTVQYSSCTLHTPIKNDAFFSDMV